MDIASDDAGIAYDANRPSTLAGRAALSPFVVLGDLGSGIANLPVNALRASYRLSSRTSRVTDAFPGTYPANYSYREKLRKGLALDDLSSSGPRGFFRPYSDRRDRFRFHIGLGNNLTGSFSERDLMHVVWTPLKGGSLAAASMGRGAWDNMILRARLLVHGHGEFFEPYPPGSNELLRVGPGLRMVKRLNHIAKQHGKQMEFYGHSMGAHVLNGIIDEIARDDHRDLKLSKLVYMGAACRINDFRRTAGRYIDASETPFYNLCLRPVQEVRESWWGDLVGPVVAGSLLTWIDAMFERPPSFGDRTLGSYMNCVLAERLLPHGQHVRLKGFGADFQRGKFFRRDKDSDLGPQKHGQFSDYQFWRAEFLEPDVVTGLRPLLVH